jgi:hypothetical protein
VLGLGRAAPGLDLEHVAPSEPLGLGTLRPSLSGLTGLSFPLWFRGLSPALTGRFSDATLFFGPGPRLSRDTSEAPRAFEPPLGLSSDSAH